MAGGLQKKKRDEGVNPGMSPKSPIKGVKKKVKKAKAKKGY